ncbi:MAG: hypothetical protein HYU29_05635 [Chloroflexi bacterium]|nr:hypothetical protein [Chloroflexota bacterium]
MKNMDDIFNDCLERLLNGESLESCIARYPDQAAHLAPILKLAIASREAMNTVRAPEGAKGRALQRIWKAGQSAKPRGLGLFARLRPWALAATALLVVALGMGTAAVASADTAPGDVLYPVKQSRERLQLIFTLPPQAKARLYLTMAQERAKEMETLLERGQHEKLEALAESSSKHLERIPGLFQVEAEEVTVRQTPVQPLPPGLQPRTKAEMREMLVETAQKHKAKMEKTLKDAPPELDAKTKKALSKWDEGYKRAIAELEKGRQGPKR